MLVLGVKGDHVSELIIQVAWLRHVALLVGPAAAEQAANVVHNVLMEAGHRTGASHQHK